MEVSEKQSTTHSTVPSIPRTTTNNRRSNAARLLQAHVYVNSASLQSLVQVTPLLHEATKFSVRILEVQNRRTASSQLHPPKKVASVNIPTQPALHYGQPAGVKRTRLISRLTTTAADGEVGLAEVTRVDDVDVHRCWLGRVGMPSMKAAYSGLQCYSWHV